MIGSPISPELRWKLAVERPPRFKAIMPIAGTFDLYESTTHHGLMRSGLITPFLSMIGMMDSAKMFRVAVVLMNGDDSRCRVDYRRLHATYAVE